MELKRYTNLTPPEETQSSVCVCLLASVSQWISGTEPLLPPDPGTAVGSANSTAFEIIKLFSDCWRIISTLQDPNISILCGSLSLSFLTRLDEICKLLVWDNPEFNYA